MPNVILEAMANGLAILASDVGATNVLVNENTGWLIQTVNPEEIKEIMVKIISMPPQAIDAKKASALHLVSERFTWEKLIKELIKKIKTL